MVYGHSVRSKDTDSVEIWKYEWLTTELTGVGARYAFASEKQALELCQLEKMRFTRSECKLLASSDLFLETYGCHCILWLKICFFFSRPNTSSPAWQFPELRPNEVFWQMPWVLTMGVHACRLADLSFLCRLGWAKWRGWVRVKVGSSLFNRDEAEPRQPDCCCSVLLHCFVWKHHSPAPRDSCCKHTPWPNPFSSKQMTQTYVTSEKFLEAIYGKLADNLQTCKRSN